MKFKKLTLLLSMCFLTSCEIINSTENNNTSLGTQIQNNSSTSNNSSSLQSSQTSNQASSTLPPIEEELKEGTKLAIPKQTGEFHIPNSDIILTPSYQPVKKEEVAAYLMAYKKLPINYFHKDDKGICRQKYPKTCMIYGSNSFGNKEGLLPKEFKYKELDLYAGDRNFTGNRGPIRLVATLGNRNYEDDAVYYSKDHYEDYSEYLNYYGGWGKTWKYDVSNKPNQTVGDKVIIGNKEITLNRTNIQKYLLLDPNKVFKY